MSVDLSVVIPARNEELRLPHTLTRLAAYARNSPHSLEVLIIDDHSSDGTRAAAHSLAGPLELRVLTNNNGRGPGAAMRCGMRHARGRRVLLCDADGPVPFETIDTLWSALDLGYDLAAGSRLQGPNARLGRPLHRRLLARGFRQLVRRLAPTPVLDTQCGFKLLEGSVAHTIGETLTVDGFVFHVELLARCEVAGFRVIEVGIPWRDIAGTKIHFFADPLRMTWQLIELRRALQRCDKSAARPPTAWPSNREQR